MTVLGLLLLSNAVLHGVVIGRFGFKGNEPPAVFGVSCMRDWRSPSSATGTTRCSPRWSSLRWGSWVSR